MKRLLGLFSLLALVTACGPAPAGNGEDAPPREGCEAPELPADGMVDGAAIGAFSWQGAFRADGSTFNANLADAACSTDPAWSPFDKLLFISIPAW